MLVLTRRVGEEIVIDDRVIVRGCTATYHSKQLALEGVLDILGSTGATQVELNIQVHLRP